ncbi:DUF2927 domain-containing protein [Thiomicrorhabdus sp. Kp2]|uniref:DUF2927 domain-containing protein n=1 Tax=Thiomicrorhabdus sp. Kp2 TaxID=1123518 RepID=UPI000687284C|nr:DUF2927 domain-containing protein [Thiomicrorhabdus sp. Kp2]
MEWLIDKTSNLPKLSLVFIGALFFCQFGNLNAAEPVSANKSLQAWQNPHYILKAFNEIALKNEYRPSSNRVVKWHQPIRYQFHHLKLKPNALVEQLFTTHLQHLASITGLEIQPTNNSNANLNIYLTQDKNYANVIEKYTGSKVKSIERDSHCMGSYTTNKQHEITRANIVIPVDHVFSRGLLVACVVEETTQVLGLPNDASWVNPSIANDDSKIELLTGLDYIMLKILYNTELKAGMTTQESRPIIQEEITKLINLGEVENAATKVNSQGLYQLVN